MLYQFVHRLDRLTVAPRLSPLELTQLRMAVIQISILEFVEECGEAPKDLTFIKETPERPTLCPIHLNGWGAPFEYMVTNNVVTLTSHVDTVNPHGYVNGDEEDILRRSFPIEPVKE